MTTTRRLTTDQAGNLVFQIIDDGRFTAELVRAGQPDAAGNVFTREALESMVREANESGRVSQMYASVGYGRKTGDIAGIVEAVEYRDGAAHVTTKLLDAPAGQSVKRARQAIARHNRFIEGRGLTLFDVPLGVEGNIIASHEEMIDGRLVRVIDEAKLTGYSILPMRGKLP